MPRRCRNGTRAQHRLRLRRLAAWRCRARAPARPSTTRRRILPCRARRRASRSRVASTRRRTPNRRARITTIGFRRHRIGGRRNVRRQTIVDAAMAARFLVAFGEAARQAEAERAVRPSRELAPAEVDQPRQADEKQRERRERRAYMPEQMAEARSQRMAEAIHAGHADQRRLECAARHQHADEAEPQPDRAGSAQACAARQCRLHETPQKRNEPDG